MIRCHLTLASRIKRTGYTRIERVDSTTCHNNGGGLHCGTNAIRDIPDDDWWA